MVHQGDLHVVHIMICLWPSQGGALAASPRLQQILRAVVIQLWFQSYGFQRGAKVTTGWLLGTHLATSAAALAALDERHASHTICRYRQLWARSCQELPALEKAHNAQPWCRVKPCASHALPV